MRKDIEISVNTADVKLVASTQLQKATFNWIDNPDGLTRYMYGEVVIPHSVSIGDLKDIGVEVVVGYCPLYKEFCVRIKSLSANGSFEFLKNPKDGSEWFICQSYIPHQGHKNTFASELIAIGNEVYCVRLDGHRVLIGGLPVDFNIIEANRQNANMLLLCHPGNNYRYPISGVGLKRWINSNIVNSGLGDVLKREFEADGLPITTATYDLESNSVNLKFNK